MSTRQPPRKPITLRTPLPSGHGLIVSVHGEENPAETLKELFERHRRRVAEEIHPRPDDGQTRSQAS